MMARFKYSVSLVIFLALIITLIGCAKPPEAEKAAAKAAMDAAVSAGADKYAAPSNDAAKKIWDSAEALMKEKKYKEAKQAYEEAKAAFEKAAAAVEEGKKAAAAEVNTALTALEEAWKNLETAAKGVEKKMKDKKDLWVADSKIFTEGLKAAKDKLATDPAGAKVNAGELKAIIDKWDAAFKELAAAPAKPEPVKPVKKPK
ncbi:MAG: DUF4398 domain-containing protein [Syntrophales bacterium LBB04]|nr:DUF4398 domain-containing protein [Syntrophales bacterium LBB04]